MIGSKRKIVILFVSDSEDHILEKILKTVEGSAGIEERTLFLEKIEQYKKERDAREMEQYGRILDDNERDAIIEKEEFRNG